MSLSYSIMSDAAEQLAARLAKANAAQKVYYAKHKDRILADLRASRVLLHEAHKAAHPEPVFEHPEVAQKMPHVMYGMEKAVDAIRRINELYPAEKARSENTLKSYVSATRAIFRKLGVTDDLRAKLMHPNRVVAKMRALIGTPKNKLSSIATQMVVILMLTDHLPGLNLPLAKKAVLKTAADVIRLEAARDVPLLKQGPEYDVPTFDRYLEMIVGAYGPTSIESLVAHLYHEIPARDNFRALHIVEKKAEASDKKLNYLVMPRGPAVVVLNVYKTAKTYGKLDLPDYALSPFLTAMLRAYIKLHKLAFGDVLFSKYQKKGLTGLVGAMNRRVGIQKLGVNALRSMQIATSEAKTAALSPAAQAEASVALASRMRHHPGTAAVYRRNLAPETAPEAAPVKRGRGRPRKLTKN